MCGIAGSVFWGNTKADDAIHDMTAALAHRGPDDAAVITTGCATLGHRRLSIIDLNPRARQPMPDAEDRFWIAYNGEIYNFRDIRRSLESDGVAFRTTSDTEVILEAYRKWGISALTRLDGMFALAIWDARDHQLLLARDRMGEKPLYYFHLPGKGVIFASDLRAIRKHPQVSSDIHLPAVAQYLSMGYVVDPDSLLEGVRKLEPAHYLVASADAAPVSRAYWSLADCFRSKAAYRSEAAATDALDDLLTTVVRDHLVSDVPVGAFLSGGVDSAAVISKMRSVASQPPVAFTIGFPEATYDESPEARESARAIGVELRERTVHGDLALRLPDIVAAIGEPLGDTSIVPTFLLAEFARESMTVCLSGDGGDEMFAGYETYAADALKRMTASVPQWTVDVARRMIDRWWPPSFGKVSLDFKIRQFLRGHSMSAERAHYAWRLFLDAGEMSALLRPDVRAAATAVDPFQSFATHYTEVADLDPLDQAQYVDCKTWLASDVLVKVDRATMAHGLESRAPLLDRRIVEFAASLPPAFRRRGRAGKRPLRAVVARRVSSAVASRPKRGFNAPVAHWFVGPGRDLGRAATAGPVLGEWFDPAAIEKLWTQHERRTHDRGLALFALTCLGLWMMER
jgi:asparagine synthase (glutamine-hydrolysing)